MNITILTLFPEIVEPFFTSSIMKRAVEESLVAYRIVNWRDYALDKHKSCDDVPFGGGAGMLLKCGPIDRALASLTAEGKRVIFASPAGRKFDQAYARELSLEKELVFICGHYEGLDQRVIDRWVDDEICVGDYVVSSGEVATLVIIDALYRLVSGVIADASLVDESFTGGLLEYPQYTRPETYCSKKVPDVLLGGHHAHIEKWHVMQRLERTLERRPELLETAEIDAASRILLNQLLVHNCEKGNEDGRNKGRSEGGRPPGRDGGDTGRRSGSADRKEGRSSAEAED